MIKRLLGTDGNLSGTILRILLGGVMLPHGAQKVLGVFGGAGFKPTLDMFQTAFHIPIYLALAAILAESLGALAGPLALVIKGAGRWSVDLVIAGK